MFTLSGDLFLVGTLGDVPYVTCDSGASLNISANVSNAFKYSITGAGKGETGNGFLSALVTSTDAFVDRCLMIKKVIGTAVRKTPLRHLHALLPSWRNIWSNIGSVLARPQCTIP